ncbi:hypothetical protein Q427_18985 [Halomonas sp. BC04]|nr:hypothetical protein Q427_18985 [Halomonas sp. BC04]
MLNKNRQAVIADGNIPAYKIMMRYVLMKIYHKAFKGFVIGYGYRTPKIITCCWVNTDTIQGFVNSKIIKLSIITYTYT